MPSPRPLFIVGFQRSGTTLLQTALGAHPRIASPPEMHFFTRIIYLSDYFGDLRDDGNLRRALREACLAPTQYVADCGFDVERLYRLAAASDRSYRGLVDVILSDFAARHGKVRWCEKTPGQRAGAIFKLFPDAQVIHLIRDPRDVVASSLDAPFNRMGARHIARAWRSFTLDNVRAGLQRGPASFFQVRYEDLTRDPEPLLALVCTFLGETFAPAMLESSERATSGALTVMGSWQAGATGPFTSSRQGRWRSSLSRGNQARVAAIVDDVLAPLGYEPTGRRVRASGRVLNLAGLPVELWDATDRRWRRRPLTPEDRYHETKRYMAQVEARVGSAGM